jgi:xanthine dehydrogenase iron-sulfur cluster and FAD-binding subunit A
MPADHAPDVDALLAEQGRYVWRLIVRVLGDDGHDAADCFQQAFVELAARKKRMGDVRDAGAAGRAEAALVGRVWDEAAAEDAASALAEDFTPISDWRASAAYRMAAAQNLIRRFRMETAEAAEPARLVRV